MTLLELCLKNTYFLFQGSYYEQVHRAAMSSPISSIVANQFMEEFETKATNTSTPPPKFWLNYVDDHSIQFLQHINAIDLHIHSTQETPNTDWSILFLDTSVSPGQTKPY